MKKTASITLSIFIAVFLLSKAFSPVSAECSVPEDGAYEQAFAECQKEIDARMPAQQKNKEDLAKLQKNIQTNQKIIGLYEGQIKNLEKGIFDREVTVELKKELISLRIRSLYKKSWQNSLIGVLLTSSSAGDLLRAVSYRQTVLEQDKNSISQVVGEIGKLSEDKQKLEGSKIWLAKVSAQLAKDAKELKIEVEKVDSYFSQIDKIQQAILAAKSGSFIASVGDSELADDYNASIKGFRESAPAGSFAVFSFGGYTHRKGMSQYGARGRAQSGQNFSQILNAYYGKTPVSKDTNGTINVAGLGNVNFEDYYLMGIAEMPSGWHAEALKAQAVAARTYAYRYKIQGKQICTTEACQVFSRSKANSPPDAWKQAVQQTRGQILEDVVTYYSSTSGGYGTPGGWDTTDGSGGSNFFDKSYEKVGGSPWAYKAWYRKGYAASGASCGQSDPWLNNEEFTDIVNAAIVLKNGSDSRVSSTSTSCWGGNPYSYSELRQKGGVESVSSVSVLQGNATTTEIVINGSIKLTGAEFKQAFNLRAPGYLMIPQKDFAFFNVEKK